MAEDQEPETVRDLKRRQVTYLVEAGLGNNPSARQLASELDPTYAPGPTHVVAHVRMKPVPKPK
jgi:hypothetical protein